MPAPLYQGEQSDIGIKDDVISSPKPLDLAPFLSCNICKGLLVSATTITNCLHSFCKSCLVKKMLNKERAIYHCPTCGSSIGGFKGIREDCHLQQIVNKVVPNLENLEAERRKVFYEGSCKEDEGILENDEKVGQRGEVVQQLFPLKKEVGLDQPTLQAKGTGCNSRLKNVGISQEGGDSFEH